MYTPALFQQTSPDRLFDLIEQHSFGLLVTQVSGQPFATHLPFLVQRSSERNGALIGHMARANPQWQDLAGQTVLTVFSGPHAYVSPSWYEAEQVVPTWNYVAVHVYGRVEIIDDPLAAAQVLADYVAFYESSMPEPWRFDSTSSFSQKLLKMIVAFRIEIDRMEGKWKLSQNQPPERQEKVARALQGSADPEAQAIARLMTSCERD